MGGMTMAKLGLHNYIYNNITHNHNYNMGFSLTTCE